MANYERLLRVALGSEPADLVILNGQLVNVVTREIYPAVVGICEDMIAYVTTPEDAACQAHQVIDAQGGYLAPGLIDSHMHIESTHATPAHFANAVLPRGVTTVAQDPHEIANVLGVEGIHYMRQASRGLPLRVLTFASTCVPSVPGLETAGAEFGRAEVEALLDCPDVIGLAEVMDYWGVIRQSPRVTEIVKAGLERETILTGHIRRLGGRELNTYLAAGIDSDHEYLDPEGIFYRSRLGMTVEICCCQARDNIPQVVQAWSKARSLDNVLFVTDDIPPQELLTDGHLDQGVRRAIKLGMDPADAIRAATLMPARRLRRYDLGQIAPGRKADLLLVSDLQNFKVALTLTGGKVVARAGAMVEPCVSQVAPPARALNSVRLDMLQPASFAVPGRGRQVLARVLAERGRRLVESTLPLRAGEVVWQTEPDLALASVWHRHGRVESHSKVLIQDTGLQAGALATTYSHDSHNLVVLGRSPEDMSVAANTLIKAGGGYTAVRDGKVLALVELPVGGILADTSVEELGRAFSQFVQQAQALGVGQNPIGLITSLPLPVVPAYRPTDLGLVDVAKQAFLEAFVFLDEGNESAKQEEDYER